MANSASDGGGKVRRITLPTPRHGAKASNASRLRAKGRVLRNGIVYSKKTGMALTGGKPAGGAAPKASQGPADAGIGDIYGSLTKAGNTLKRTR